jgi:hypothetical protein
MKLRLARIGKALKAVAKDEKNRREFMRACEKLKKKHAKVNDIRLQMLKACLREMDAIGFPVTAEEKDLMAEIIKLYDKTLSELSQDINRFRGYIEE